MYGTITVWPIRCFFYNSVASFASTHSKTLQSDVIGRRQHGIRDHSSISTLMTKLLRKQWILTISPLVSDCRIGYNFSVSYSNGLTYRQTMPSHSIHVYAKFRFENFNSKHDIVVGIYHARNNHFLTNQMLSDSHVAYFASTHSKTRHSDVIWCRQHGRRDHSSISTLMTTLIRTQWIITISPFVSDCTIGNNLSVSYNTRLKCRQTMPSHSIHVHAQFHLENFNSKHDIVVAIYHVRNNHFLANQMSFDSHVASFASTHSKTCQSDVIWCRQYGRRDHGSISTLMTTLLRKQWLITISPFVSDCTIGYHLSVSYNTRLKSRWTIQSHTLYVPAKNHFDTFYIKQDIAVGIFHVRNNHFWPIRCFSTIMSLLLHQHIRKHASRM